MLNFPAETSTELLLNVQPIPPEEEFSAHPRYLSQNTVRVAFQLPGQDIAGCMPGGLFSFTLDANGVCVYPPTHTCTHQQKLLTPTEAAAVPIFLEAQKLYSSNMKREHNAYQEKQSNSS